MHYAYLFILSEHAHIYNNENSEERSRQHANTSVYHTTVHISTIHFLMIEIANYSCVRILIDIIYITCDAWTV